MSKTIKLNEDIGLDYSKIIEGGLVILANSGGGKSYAIRRIAEQAVGLGQIIILDPEGEFASLREKYDFILAGKDADVPVEVRSASMLAIRLLELNKSAVIDLYELHPHERQRYVKLFCEALVNAPKHLYHPVIIVLDEAHEYVPEGKPSEATWAVESLASKGRKRGMRLVPASQRIAKISKNVTAECNNKLIGRASQDIDMKRAGDELGFNKEKLVQLRQLKPGEFFAFGPAISDDVIKLKIGEVKTAHAKVGYKRGRKSTPPPSEVIRKVLAELKDLPHEAEKEAKTLAEVKKENIELKRKLAHNPQKIVESDPKLIEKVIKDTEKRMNIEFMAERDEFIKHINTFFKIIETVGRTVKDIKMPDIKKREEKTEAYKGMFKQPPKETYMHAQPFRPAQTPNVEDFDHRETMAVGEKIGKCSKAIYTYLMSDLTRAFSKTQVAVAVGYSQSSGGFNNSISELSAMGLIIRQSGGMLHGRGGAIRDDLITPIDLSLEKWSAKLGACSRKIWEFLLNNDRDSLYDKNTVANETGYSATSGGFNNSISELSALGLIKRENGGIRINPEIL